AIRQRTQVATIAAHQQRAEMLVRRSLSRGRTIIAAAIIMCVLERRFFLRAAEAWTCRASVGCFPLAHLADPAFELVGIKMAVAAIGQRCEGAVGKRQQRSIGAFGWT